jgi:hypothetical protein
MDREKDAIEQCFQQLFAIRTEYRIIQCVKCQYAVNPSHIHGHLRDKHQTAVNPKMRNGISRYVRESVESIAWEKKQVVYLEPNSPPVQGLPLYQNGFRCVSTSRTSEECGYICRTIQGIQEHCKTVHGWVNVQKQGGNVRKKTTQTPNRLWVKGQACQTFFTQRGWQSYFAVKPADPVQPSPAGQQTWRERVQAAMRTKLAAEADEKAAHRDTIRNDDSRFVTNTWLEALECASHLHGHDREQMIIAITPIEKPSQQQQGQRRIQYEDEHSPDSDFGLERACLGTRRS